MRQLFKLTLYLFVLNTSCYGQEATPPDFESHNLPVVWGESRWSGPEDLQASVQVISQGDTLVIKATIEDDVVVWNSNPYHSDHVELWLASEQSVAAPFFIWRGSAFQDSQGGVSVEQLAADGYPVKGSEFDQEEEDYLNRISYQATYRWPATDELKTKTLFYNVPHLGFLPEDHALITYDRHLQLDQFGEMAPISAQEFHVRGIQEWEDSPITYHDPFATQGRNLYSWQQLTQAIRGERTAVGYTLEIRLPVSALGFLHVSGLSNCRLMIDVIDVDNSGKQESLASTSANRVWGDVRTFSTVTLGKPLVPMEDLPEPLGDWAGRNLPLCNMDTALVWATVAEGKNKYGGKTQTVEYRFAKNTTAPLPGFSAWEVTAEIPLLLAGKGNDYQTLPHDGNVEWIERDGEWFYWYYDYEAFGDGGGLIDEYNFYHSLKKGQLFTIINMDSDEPSIEFITARSEGFPAEFDELVLIERPEGFTPGKACLVFDVFDYSQGKSQAHQGWLQVCADGKTSYQKR